MLISGLYYDFLHIYFSAFIVKSMKLLFIFLSFLVLPTFIAATPGRLDLFGGHFDKGGKGYHYHKKNLPIKPRPRKLYIPNLEPTTTKGVNTNKYDNIIRYANLPDDKTMFIQSSLKLLGYFHGPIDGRYGKGTKRSVERYQKRFGLPITGNMNTATRAKILEGLNAVLF